MFDMREREKANTIFRTGGHDGMIKSIKLESDDSLVMTGGMDGTLRLWDIGKRAVIKVFATEHKSKYLDYEFHSSSIWSILPD